ncbi:nitroreductase family deazaflavin-dependent oxidoreductase [Nocardioides coralli]|uniref:nitroreductase family deazaflavin-dependent oxidoreductase n=1 Tax=Nocardioides coralli TaxID=2872154 RepID=UPI002017B540|nr:nitroreductase family deazaflavin-dependent oxidoreductase [Nocardioides coralli]
MRGLAALGALVLRTPALARAPVPLYRHGLGWLLGPRLMMLEHRGRRTGEARYACLEVVERPEATRVVVASGLGERAQWYRNLRADPTCFVSVGRLRRRPATARVLGDAEASAVLERYREAHPRAWRTLRAAIEAAGGPADHLPVVELVLSAPARP